MKNKNVQISAEEVIVQGRTLQGNKTSSKRKQRNRKQNNANSKLGPSAYVQTGLANLGKQSSDFTTKYITDPKFVEGFSEQSKQFFELYCDPNGERNSSTDAARIPDGALQTSAGAFFRSVNTMSLPLPDTATDVISLDGRIYSLMFLQYPMLRCLSFALIQTKSQEFSKSKMLAFCEKFAQLVNKETAFYPNWVQIEPEFYFTAIDTTALRNIVPPDTEGNSGTVDSWRMSSQGIELLFNTPDLINQGTVTAMRYPVDGCVKDVGQEPEVRGIPEYLACVATRVSSTEIFYDLNIRGNVVFPRAQGNNLSFPTTPMIAPDTIRNASGSFVVHDGDPFYYDQVVETDIINVYLVDVNSGDRVSVLTVYLVTGSATQTTRLYRMDGSESEPVVNTSMNVISLPPVTQADMLQQNPKSAVTLLKQDGGLYLVGCILEPVFSVTQSSEYFKQVFTTLGSSITAAMLDPEAGWTDTIDKNFGVSVINCQGIPYACRPMLKICRSVEIVPASDSLVGAFTTGCPAEQPEVIDLCKAFAECQPHGYPPGYNGLGILFGKALRCVQAIAPALRSGRNIYRTVKEVCDGETYESNGEIGDMLAMSIKRLLRG